MCFLLPSARVPHAIPDASPSFSGTVQSFSSRCLSLLEKEMVTYSSIFACKIPIDRGAWQATVHGVVKSRTRVSDFIFTFLFHALEKETATHSSVLAWRLPGMEAWWAAVYGVAEPDVT